MNHRHPDGHDPRVRHVPIHVERRDGDIDGADENSATRARYGSNQFHRQQQPQWDGQFNRHQQTSPNSQSEQSHHRESTRPARSPNTSNVDIKYEAPIQQQQRSRQQQRQQPTHNHEAAHSHHSRHIEQDLAAANNQSDPMDVVQDHDHQTNYDKENDEKFSKSAARAKLPQSRTLSPDTPIPMPPPPERSKSSSKSERASPGPQNQQQSKQQEEEGEEEKQKQQQQDIETTKNKKPIGPVEIIEATRNKVYSILKEIVTCNETSQESKEYRRLDELLTRCVLELDNIDCTEMPELRPQRKAIIAMIDKCTDIMKRKVSLNYDIYQMTSKIP